MLGLGFPAQEKVFFFSGRYLLLRSRFICKVDWDVSLDACLSVPIDERMSGKQIPKDFVVLCHVTFFIKRVVRNSNL